jgi:AcrR family transcriptional regulator
VGSGEPYPRAVTDPAPIPAPAGEDPTRDRLIEAAAAVFAEKGYDGAGVQEIARRAVITTVGSHLVTEPFDEGQALLLEAFVAARRDPEVAALVRGLLEQRAHTFATLVEAAKANGQVAADLDTEAVVRFCHAVGFGFLLFGAIDLAHPPAEPWERLIARLVDALGDGPAG